MTPPYASAEVALPLPGDEPAALAAYCLSVNDAREQLGRLVDGLQDAGAQLTSCWTSAGQVAASAEVQTQIRSATAIVARLDTAMTLVGGFSQTVTAARQQVQQLREMWAANVASMATASAASAAAAAAPTAASAADIAGFEDQFEAIGEDWRTIYQALKVEAGRVEEQLNELTWGMTGSSDTLSTEIGLDALVFDDNFSSQRSESGWQPQLSPTQQVFLEESVHRPTPVTPSMASPTASFPVKEYQAAVAAAALRDPVFGKLFGDSFAVCTDYACVLEAANRYEVTRTTLALADASVDATVQGILQTAKLVTVGDCFEGNAVDCAMIAVPLFGKGGKFLGWVENAEAITGHGALRLGDRGMGRFAIEAALEGRKLKQADGAFVYVNETSPGRFTFIVVDERGIVTAGRDWSLDMISNTAKIHGWEGWP